MEDKARMNCVSQYYRRLTEPLLYENICMHTDEDDRIKRLLITLIQCKILRPLIKRFDLYHTRNVDPPRLPHLHDLITYDISTTSASVCELLCAHAAEIQEALATVALQLSISADLRLIWYTELFHPYPVFDGALALLLSVVPNISFINMEICPDHYP